LEVTLPQPSSAASAVAWGLVASLLLNTVYAAWRLISVYPRVTETNEIGAVTFSLGSFSVYVLLGGLAIATGILLVSALRG